MLVVVASRHDREAAALAERWASVDATILTCEDLSTAGWQYVAGDPRSSTAVVGSTVVPVSVIRGVLTRRPRVFEQELTRFTEADRDYVAAEMNAFLLAWLSSLECPVVNPPTPGCLCGPSWSPLQWTHAAASLGLPVRPERVSVGPTSNGSAPVSTAPAHPVEVTVVDGRAFGGAGEPVEGHARRLAAFAGVRFLSVVFDGGCDPPVFVAAQPIPSVPEGPVGDPIREALLHALLGSGAGGS